VEVYLQRPLFSARPQRAGRMFESAAALLASSLIFSKTNRRAIAYDQVELRLLSVNVYCRRSGDHGLIEGYSDIRTTATPFPIIYMHGEPNHQPLRSSVTLRVWQLQCSCSQKSSEWASASQHHGSGSMLSASIR
jgi:hypothetical protein